MAKPVQEINAGSMADIAFLLLIFFLVTTTMDTDSGIIRRLPPMPEKQKIKAEKVNKRNALDVRVSAWNALMVNGEIIDISQLRERTKEFIANPKNLETLPVKKTINVPFFGNFDVPEGVISMKNDRGTSYDTYLTVQNELVAAYNELRNELSMIKFGRPFGSLTEDEQDAVRKIYPTRISEAEPEAIGNNQ